VAITRQARDPPHPDEKSKDKFLILSMPVGDVDASADFAALWSHLEENFKDQIQNKKIRVHYQFNNPDMQTSATAEPAAVGPARVHATGNDELSAAAAVAGAAGVAASNGGDESFAEKSMNEYGTPLKHAPAQPARYDQAPVSSPSTPAPGPGRSTSSKTSSTSSGLTSRSADKSTTSSSTASNSNNTNTATAVRSRQAANGVPIHIVVALALLAFFIGWKFF
jgi:cobalamin biosynthesis Mg chelatase CobN